MGKASSSKKIARAARAGGRVSGVRQRNLLFPGTIAAIVVFGLAMVGYSVTEHKDEAKDLAPTYPHDGKPYDHWHAAYGINICGEWQAPIPEFESPIGIHTHADGVIHIHPFTIEGAGENATLGNFFKYMPDSPAPFPVKLSDSKLTYGGKTWETDKSKCDGKDGELVVARWEDVETTTKKPALLYKNFDDIRFRDNGEGYTIAFVKKDDKDIPKPESAAKLSELGAADSGNTQGSTTTAGDGATSTTAPGATPTTAAGATTSTTKAPG